ncbi:MAG: PAS domain-containing protein, partial [Sphingomonas sp.]
MTSSIPRPKADRTQLQQIIAGLPEGVIIIDPDQTIAWSNQAALAMHGVTSLEELGRTVTEYRERFVLHYRNSHKLPAGHYPMDRVIAGEAFTQVVVEVTLPGEERHRVQQIRSMIITDPAGDPDCLVLILEDETERFSAEERFERTFNANPAPAIIVRLGDGRYVKVNQGFMEMTGFAKEALIGRSMHDYDVLDGAEKRDLAVDRLQIREGEQHARLRADLDRLPGDDHGAPIAGGRAQQRLHLRDRRARMQPIDSQVPLLRPVQHVVIVHRAPDQCLLDEAGHLHEA